MTGFIAVHAGAGYHSENLRPAYKKACKDACTAAMELLKDGCNSVEAVCCAVSVLEDCPITNAGIGSNMTISGTIECDAAVMEGEKMNFGSVGALQNVKNPVKVAQKVLEEQNKGLLSGGRIPPCTIVGQGATDWAIEHGFQLISNNHLVTSFSERAFIKNMALVGKYSNKKTPIPKQSHDNSEMNDKSLLLDTVGAVCVDNNGNVSSAVSSGGILLKHPGRIGQASVYGAGCWAENSIVVDKPSIACSVTGAGEYLIKTLFAKEYYTNLYNNPNGLTTLPETFKKYFLESRQLRDVSLKNAGVLSVKHYASDNLCDLSWVHNTQTMVLGYMSSSNKKPFSFVSMSTNGLPSGKNIISSEICVRF